MAASNMRDIKRRIRSVNSMEHITNAMKLVSAAKLRKAKNTFEKTREYFHYVTESIEEIFHNTNEVPDQYLRGNREIKTTCYIIITSCRGLCGSFNSNVIKEATRAIEEDPEKPVIVAIGTKGKEHFQKRGYDIHGEYMLPPESISFMETHDISKPIIDMYNEGKIDEVVLIYTSFVSSLEQKVKCVTLLPFEIDNDPEFPKLDKQVDYEPSVEEVFNYLVPKYVEIMVYGAIVESATCEHAARRMAMENATDNAREMIADLTLFYNRTRQAAITNEISEIVGGAEALR
ncbi:ATP synthase F1 subunit gamma [Sinanaerobacter chloroacetimidivorans]|jgi:F-type H+-transporting ATPase subunit gamma|uniref:ATP synthase gamma chain n=1 Tax=Sinanaerobacter chloroacetimidivorans TaxID=2818044 RepID=A0A8J8B2Y0_9FIRM|nr:ATP synthase F1 subunit gamma [Sinanaerobacter chloroacetimidivorans]MBR0599182.1 ATP synthase F1 subunit gamma [Sinanaerobacter chloroacetimidivorans]